MKIHKLYLLIVFVLGPGINLFSQSAALDITNLTETQLLGGHTAKITLTGEKFNRDGLLNKTGFILVNHPAELSIFSITANSDSTEADVVFEAEDFDQTYSGIYIAIEDFVLLGGDTLNTGTFSLTANVETAALVPENTSLTEHNIGTDYLKILPGNGEEYIGTPDASHFTLKNFPGGASISSVDFRNKFETRLSLAYDPAGGEFDNTITNAFVIIDGAVLKYTSDTLGTDELAITGYDESVSVTGSGNLSENNLDNGTLELTLYNEDVSSLDKDDLELINFPTGTSIQSASISGDVISIDLAFDGTDFDLLDNDGQVKVLKSVLRWNKEDDLYTTPGEIIISAFVEVPGATIDPDIPLQEYNLDGRTLSVTLTYDSLVTPFSLVTGDITLIGEPAELTVGSVSVKNAMEFDVTLSYTHNDFDADIELGLSINHLKLKESTSNLVSSNTATITHYKETPVATVTPSSDLKEVYLDTISLYLEFSEEKFSSAPGVSDFDIVDGPAGLDINGISGFADSSITLHLRFDGTDFDADFNNAKVSVQSGVLDQTESGLLLSEPFLIESIQEPVVDYVSIDNSSMKIGDPVEVTIYLSEYETGSSYTLAPINPKVGGYDLGSLNREGADRYTAWFTVAEFGDDYPDSVDIPVNNLQLIQLPVTGELYNGFISQDNDLLDANRPDVSTLYVIGQEAKKIGDNVVLLISAFEEGLLPEDSTEINGIVMTPDKVVFEEIGGGTYSLIYTIGPNDANVAKGALEAKIYLRDPAGNINETYPPIQPNDLSIDASVPVIYSTTNTTPTDTVIIGEEVVLTIRADGAGYELSSASEVNGVRKNEGLIFTDFPDSTYTIRYPVKDIDATVAAKKLKASIILEDEVGNGSLPDTVILDNDVAVFTQRPTARLTLGDEICIYDTATIYMTLSGSPPWKIKYQNAVDSFYMDNIQGENFSVKVNPEQTMNYIIDSVWDGTGNSNIGFGNAIVIVNPLPVVSIIDLDTIYAVTDTNVIHLNGDPSGGDFFGPGVNSVEGTFTPSKAGLTGTSPHKIFYEYTDPNLCFNVDTHEVLIVDAAVTFTPGRPIACYLDEEYVLEAFNTASTIGSFSIVSKSYPDGFMVDNGNNTVTFNPSILPWVSGQDYMETFTVRYDYLDGTTPLNTTIPLEIEYFDTAYITTDLLSYDSCSYDKVLPLNGTRTAGKFTGKGVVEESQSVYNFNPSLADTGANWIVYTYTSNNGCKQYDSSMIMVYEVPNPEFEYINYCVPTGGGDIQFRNISDTTGLGGTVRWEWNFGDVQSGEKNEELTYSMDDVKHRYSRPGERQVTLTATVEETGCNRTEITGRYIGNVPDLSISWNTECYTSDSTTFTGKSETEDGKSYYKWAITDQAGTLIRGLEGLELNTFEFRFDELDIYNIELIATSDSGCVNSEYETIYLRPYISTLTDTTPYFENFEDESNGWYAFNLENSTHSWVLEQVKPGKFPYDEAGSGNRAWFTDSVNQNTVEQSWVTSPCFDFRGMRRPMISLDRKISSDRDRDGAVLQYSYDDGGNWHNVGAVDDGSVNWYNTFRISNGPGGQAEGWTGGFIFDGSEPWKNSRHDLDGLINRPRVQFRIAYSSSDTSVVRKEGFAFDNVWIGERSRIVLLEHFTNAGIEEIEGKNQRINELVQHNLLDVIDLQYHAEVEGESDRMNADNPSPASARSLFYGTRKVPYTLIDGGLNGEMAYDYTENNDLDTLDLASRILADPSFKIDLEVMEQANSLDISVGLEALESLPSKEYIVFTAIIEKHINESSYLVSGADTAFQNVVRDMVPNAAGVSLIRQWEPGDKEIIPLSWDISNYILNRELLTVVVFVQGAENRVIYQVASNDPELNGDPVSPVSVQDILKARNIDMLVYPNPAGSHVYLAFAEPLAARVEIQLFTHTGSLVMNKQLAPGTELHELSLTPLSKGVYFIRAIQNGQIIGTRKLIKLE